MNLSGTASGSVRQRTLFAAEVTRMSSPLEDALAGFLASASTCQLCAVEGRAENASTAEPAGLCVLAFSAYLDKFTVGSGVAWSEVLVALTADFVLL